MRFEFRFVMALTLSTPLVFVACGDDDDPNDDSGNAPLIVGGTNFALSSVTRNPDGSRTTFVQTIDSLDEGPFDNSNAIEVQGNAVVLSSPGAFYVGLPTEPTWIRYSVNNSGETRETGRLSLLEFGQSRLGFSNVLVDANTAVSVLVSQASAVVWNPTTMEVIGEVEIPGLEIPQSLQGGDPVTVEAFSASTFNGLVYIPSRFATFPASGGVGVVAQEVILTILDPTGLTVIGTARDDRCASGGRPVFDEEGYAYVLGDGRNNIINLFAELRSDDPVDTCILRIAPGETDFETDYFYTIPSLTDGRQAISELIGATPDGGTGFARIYYPERVPDDVPVDLTYEFWDAPAHRVWRIELDDPPTAEVVEGLPFAAVGFVGSAVDGRLYSGESPDNVTSDVFEVAPSDAAAQVRFTMDGLFEGLYSLR
ncbi:MAG: hypothetical protein AAFQ65_15460 [Myxococcota bacterium]